MSSATGRDKGRRNPKQRSKADQKRAALTAQKNRLALETLSEKRRPFEPLLRQIVEATLHFAIQKPGDVRGADAQTSSNETWLEIGSGLGQLRSLLPEAVRSHVTHTELSQSLVRGLLEKHPEARALAASASNLPFENASVSVVLGLCVFDSLPEPAEAAREISRVLVDGGRFIHFLDAATNVEPVLADLIDAGRLPLPNFFQDVALRRPELVDGMPEHFTQPYHDLLSVPFQQFEAVLELLRQARHPLAEMLKRYSSVFFQKPFRALSAAREFVKLTSDAASGRPLNQALMSLFTTLQQSHYSQRIPFDVRSHSSLRHFSSRLERHFGPDSGYELRLATVVYARSHEAAGSDPLRARVRRVGIGQNGLDWPAPIGVPAQRLMPDLASGELAGATPETHVLREAAVYCLVAEKLRATDQRH